MRFTPEQLAATPSVADGIAPHIERRMRRLGCAQICDMAARLYGGGPDRPAATNACVLFHRFYMRHSFARQDRVLVASACMFLAAKLVEMHRSTRTLVELTSGYVRQAAEAARKAASVAGAGDGAGAGVGAAAAVAHADSRQAASSTLSSSLPPLAPPGSPSSAPGVWVTPAGLGGPLDPTSPEAETLKRRLLDTERRVLYTLEFDVAVQLPYPLITQQLRSWRDSGVLGLRSDKSPELAALDRVAGEVAAEFMTSELCLYFTPPEVATLSIYIAWRHLERAGVATRLTRSLFIDPAAGGPLITPQLLAAGVQLYTQTIEAAVNDAVEVVAAKRERINAAAAAAPTAAAAASSGGSASPAASAALSSGGGVLFGGAIDSVTSGGSGVGSGSGLYAGFISPPPLLPGGFLKRSASGASAVSAASGEAAGAGEHVSSESSSASAAEEAPAAAAAPSYRLFG